MCHNLVTSTVTLAWCACRSANSADARNSGSHILSMWLLTMSCISTTTGPEGGPSFRCSSPPARCNICTHTHSHRIRERQQWCLVQMLKMTKCTCLSICIEQHEDHLRRMRVHAEEKLSTVGDSIEDSCLLLRSSSSPLAPLFSSSPACFLSSCIELAASLCFFPFSLIYFCTHSH